MTGNPFPLNIIYADTDLGSISGVAILHYVIWFFFSPFVVTTALTWVNSKKEYLAEIDKNFVEEAKAYGIPPVEYWAILVRAGVHHGTGGLFMALGMYLGQPWIWRHGIMTEVGGMDILDFSQMISTKLGYPVEPWATKYGTPAWILLGCHHMCGILTGFPVAMMFSDLSDYQWIGLILLGLPCPFMFIQAFDGVQDHAAMDGSYFHLGCAILEFGLMFHQRVLMLTPLAFACIADSHSKNGYLNSIPFGFGFAFMTVLDLVFVLTTFKAIVLAVKDGHFTPGSARKVLRRGNTTGGYHSHVSTCHHHMVTQVLIASKLHSKAMDAKARLAAKKD